MITTTTLPPEGDSTHPPVTDFAVNEWAGKTLQDVEKFALQHSKGEDGGHLNLTNPVVVDEQGFRDKTCIILDREYQYEPIMPLDKFRKTRVPWSQTYIMWCNLDISNMDFEEYCDYVKGDVGDGWWEYNFEDTENEKAQAERASAIKALEELGFA